MASWKEKGEVPDSDDEDDDDSQGVLSVGYVCGSFQAPGDAPRKQVEDSSELATIGRLQPRSTIEQPSQSPRVFKRPPTLFDPGKLPDSSERSPQVLQHAEEEISHSYVKLSSSLSGLKTVPDVTQHLDNAAATNEREPHDSKPKGDLLPQTDRNDQEIWKDIELLCDQDDFSSISRRTLRQRNPIQLHPYALEGEKYRRTLMARGMRPLRLAQIREGDREPARDKSTPDSDFDKEYESQLLSVEDEIGPPLKLQISTPAELHNSPPPLSTESGGDDDEFPDIDQLLDMSNEQFVQAGPKRRKTASTSRYRSRMPSDSPPPRVAKFRSTSSKETEMLDIPPSPPATSSPIPVFRDPFSDDHSKLIASKLASSRAVSRERTGSEKAATTGNLPTPATDLVKHTIDLTVEELSGEDPFASDSDSSVVSRSSAMDQSNQVRRVGKRIHGVLPASWLRLDQQTRKDRNAEEAHYEHRSQSPTRAVLFRRGVAVRKDVKSDRDYSDTRKNSDHFILSDSDEDQIFSPSGYAEELAPDYSHETVFSQTDMGSVMEDDRIDAMLPPQKRQTKLLPVTARHRRRPVPTSIFLQRQSGPRFQPKITDHLEKGRNSISGSHNNKRRRKRTAGYSESSKPVPSQRHKQSFFPKLSILDAVKSYGESRKQLPVFIRIAARNAKSRKGLGRHSPTRKNFKLANRADTQEVQSVLRDWREGTLFSQAEFPDFSQSVGSREPLSCISDNVRNPNSSTVGTETIEEITAVHQNSLSRMIVSSRSSTQPKLARSIDSLPVIWGQQRPADETTALKGRIRVPKIGTSAVRPAQLETSVSDYGVRHPNLAFGSTKKVLDTLYRKAHRGNKTRGDMQLARFFEDKPLHSCISKSIAHDEIQQPGNVSMKLNRPLRTARSRKRVPHRVDANAAVFRQPNEPLVLDFLHLTPKTHETYVQDGKLLGLGNFGVSYTHDFDVFPLQPGAFFHKSTFVGSGRLSRALENSSNQRFDSDCGYSEFQLAGKKLRWGLWNSTVSSELGMCFDWIVEQLEDSQVNVCEADENALVDCITHVIDYAQDFLRFPNSGSRSECMLRTSQVLSGFAEQLEVLARRSAPSAEKLRVFIELSCRMLVLSFQFLKFARLDCDDVHIVSQLECLLRKAASLTVSLLLSLGLAPLHSFYDDLQYQAQREAGIKCDRYFAQAWVITIHAVYAAQIPHVTFWELVNSQLIGNDETQLKDARVLERKWYDMFSLLPLTDFDLNGVLVPGARLLKSFENWALPQRMAKKIFELYNSKSRQSSSFNGYCRALFCRCIHLMQAWGWRRHGIIVGTLFDFFAKRKLAHLRNEEVYKSPSFLEELDKDPSLNVDPDDRCFHILLKIIAISLKQMREAGDNKGIRNLVARVLPNHDRQYPKEKTVHQRDLASLRNHHDLLCTLFWAAPPELRPSITLIRELVNPESSHQQAYLINLRSWENLTRFVLASDPTPSAYLPLAAWQNESFTRLLSQHQSAEKDIQDQLRSLPAAAKQLVSQHTIESTVVSNQKQIIMVLEYTLIALKRSVIEAKTMKAVQAAVFNSHCINEVKSALDMLQHRNPDDMPLVEVALDIVSIYATRLVEYARTSGVRNQTLSEDSQEYGSDVFMEIQVGCIEYIGAINGDVMTGVRDVLRIALRTGIAIRPSLFEKIIDTWAVIAGSLILTQAYTLSDFFSHRGVLSEFDMKDENASVRNRAAYFLSKVLAITGDDYNPGATDRDYLSEWICILIKPLPYFHSEHELLPKYARCDQVVDRAFTGFLRRRTANRRTVSTLRGVKSCRSGLINETLQIMSAVLREDPSEREHYQGIIIAMLNQMKADMESFAPLNDMAKEHRRFVISVHSLLGTYFADLCTIDLSSQFFSTEITYIDDRDSHTRSRQILATLRNYGLRLGTDRSKNELNHFVLGVLKVAAIKNKLGALSKTFHEAIGNERGHWADLSTYFMTELIPSFIRAASLSEQGWLLLQPLFDAVQEHLMEIADCDTSRALTGVNDIMACIVKSVISSMAKYDDSKSRARTSYESAYNLLLSTRFMVATFDWLPFIMEFSSEHTEQISQSLTFFYHFACGAESYLRSPLGNYIKSLPRFNYPESGFDDRELRIAHYENVMDDDTTFVERGRALDSLISPFNRSLRTYNDMENDVNQLHRYKFRSIVWLFHDMRHSGYFNESKGAIKIQPRKIGTRFSDVILADYRENWTRCRNSPNYEIKFGQTLRVAKGLEGGDEALERIYNDLLKGMKEYVGLYRKLHGIRSPSDIARDARREYDENLLV